MQHPELRKHVQKLYYAHEWAQSITDSHLQSEATTSMLEEFHRELGTIREAMHKFAPSTKPIDRAWLAPAIKQYTWL